MTNVATVTSLRDVTKLVVGDVIAAAYLPLRRSGRVIFVRPFAPNERERWVFVAYEMDNRRIDGTAFLAGEGVRLDFAAPVPTAVPAPIAAHYDTTDPDAGDESCACGAVFQSREQLTRHIADPSGEVADEPKCTPACDALQADPAKTTGLDRSWHSDDCPVPVMHLVLDGEHATVCGIAHADRPEAHGRTPDHEDVTCKTCLDRMPF